MLFILLDAWLLAGKCEDTAVGQCDLEQHIHGNRKTGLPDTARRIDVGLERR
jgi:hypothetical protein